MNKGLRTTIPHYSYKQKHTAEKTIYKRIAIILGVTLVLVIAIWYWGITFISILGFLGTDDDTGNTTPSIDLPLRKPTLEELPEFISKDNISVTGSVNPEVKLTLFVNGIEAGETTSDAGGKFSFVNVSLKDDLNLIKVVSERSEDRQETTLLITLDNVKPKITLTSPKNGETFDKGTNSVSVKGSTEPDSIVFVNLFQAITDNEGNFTYQLNVSPGENKIEVRATDEAGNSDTTKITVAVKK